MSNSGITLAIHHAITTIALLNWFNIQILMGGESSTHKDDLRRLKIDISQRVAASSKRSAAYTSLSKYFVEQPIIHTALLLRT